MTDTIANLLAQPEGKTLEFKRDLSSPRPLLTTLTAFANSAGGTLIVGVADDRSIIGVDDPLDEEERLCNLIADGISPRLVPNIEMTTVEGKTLLLVEVFLSGMRPHWLKREGIDAGVYVRLGSSNRQADPQLTAELQRGAAGVDFDSLPMPQLSKRDLDMAAIEEDFREKPLNEATLQSLKLLMREQGKLVPTHGGILLYGKNRRFHFDDAWIQCGRFIGTDKADIFDHIDIEAPLPKAVDEIMLFLKKHAMRGADFSEIRRKDIWSIPINIMREVVVNALVHADYSQRGTPFRIAFFDNRIEVESPGLLLPGLTVEELKQGISKIRNPVIARVFKELDLIEQWGSGIPGIFRQVKSENLPEPQIEEIAGRVRFHVPISEPFSPTRQQSRKAAETAEPERPTSPSQPKGPVGGPVGGPVSYQVLAKAFDSHSRRILLVLSDTPLSAKELAEVLELETKSGAFKRAIRSLLDQDLVAYTIPDKPQSRLQKYRLTDKGRLLTTDDAKTTQTGNGE